METDPILAQKSSSYSQKDAEVGIISKNERIISKDANGDPELKEPSYYNLIRSNRPFRLYLLSYLTANIGLWLTYVASLSTIATLYPRSYIRVAILVILRLLPNFFASALGGVLADYRDRRTSMIFLDLLGAIVALSYILVIKTQSIMLLYFLAFTQECIDGFYEPVRSAIMPMFISNDEYLLKANTLSGLTWSVMAAIGSGLGGYITTTLGMQGCFIIDSLTYLLSAYLIWEIGGTWKADNDLEEEKPAAMKNQSSWSLFSLSYYWDSFKTMFFEGLTYITSSSFGPLVLLKSSGSILYGAYDVLNVALSKVPDNAEESNLRLSLIFSFVGIGCILGVTVGEYFIDVKKAESIQLMCILSIGIISISSAGMGMFSSFESTCFFSLLRASGSATLYIYSSLIIQMFTDEQLLGRVTSIEYALVTLFESASALYAGIVFDVFQFSAQESCWGLFLLGSVIFCVWYYFNLNGGGLANDSVHTITV